MTGIRESVVLFINVVSVCWAGEPSAARKTSVNFATPPKRAKKVLPPPPSLTRAPGWISQCFSSTIFNIFGV